MNYAAIYGFRHRPDGRGSRLRVLMMIEAIVTLSMHSRHIAIEITHAMAWRAAGHAHFEATGRERSYRHAFSRLF